MKRVKRVVVALWVLACCAPGCSRDPEGVTVTMAPESAVVGSRNLVLHVPEMAERLELF